MCKRTGTVKRLLCLLIALVLILSLSGSKVYAVSVPMLPYVPPYDVQMFDMLFNAFGLTVPDIEDDSKRLEGYWKLFESATIANVEATKQLIQNAFDKAKTSRVIELSPDDINVIRLVGKVALDNGVQSGYSAPVADLAQVHQELLRQGITIDESKLLTMYNYAKAQLGFDISLCYIWGFRDSSNTILFGWHDKTKRATFSNAVPYKWQVNGQTWITQYDITPTGVVGSSLSNARYAIELSSYWTGLRKAYDFGEKYDVKAVVAQNTAVSDAITQGTLIPITAATEIVNGVIDDTKPLRISLPNVLPLPAETAADLPAVQEQLGVVPISDDVTDTVDQLKQAVTDSIGSASDYAIDLTQYFPFCLPFDIFRIIGALIAEPEAPKFSYTIENPFANDDEHNITLEIDLAMFDQLAEILRTLESILFVIGLCVVTRSHYLRG